MSSRLGQWASLSFALAMAGAVLLGPATKARATLTLEAQETTGATVNATLYAQDGSGVGATVQNFFGGGTALTTVADSSIPGGATTPDGEIDLGATNAGITFGNFSVRGSTSDSDSPGTSTFAQLISTSLSVTNNTSVAHTITLVISDTGFTQPTPPLFGASAGGQFNVVSGSGATVAGDAAQALAFAGFGANNGLFGNSVSVQNFSYSTATDPTNPTTTASFSNNVPNSILGPGTVSYSMTVELVFTVAGNNILSSRSDSITAVNVTPEPATLAMAFSALPLLGLAAWRKRRKSA